ncbi:MULTISPECIES: inorganic phosphate transporter [Atopobiaceae]|uniref:Inorganic phosphate transporter, PiT family n=1 Tax=Parafannyhessea umbonata TaxID=604330 RepID=A0A1H6I3U6_9ACTN|nr:MULTISPECIES: inorganic phosphate transporter [Atopobiaceae]SEH42193.1 inorganic phosphate transporter, PiT family [Parafannyhessea umbonata]SJZ56060.1 inorganic phosphate transporter, PiT family [Olsenella sp. KH1P3]
MVSALLVCVLVAALVFEFINGFHDTANAIATTVYTKALPVRTAIAMSAVMNFVGALTSEKVALTISKGLVDIQLDLYVILAALIGAIVWDFFTWWRSIPSSSSHALIGSLIGATIVHTGTTQHVIWDGVVGKVVIPLFTSPLIGMALGFLIMKLVFELFANWTPHKANGLFHKLEIVSSAFMAYSHGNNDAQKTMGIITLALVSAGLADPALGVPLWVKITCAVTMAIGTSIGGQRIMRTVGDGVTKLTPVIGFVAQTSSTVAIELMTALGAPVSTTQVVTTSIMGAGSARRRSSVRWGAARKIIAAWFITLPITILLGGLSAFFIGRVLGMA